MIKLIPIGKVDKRIIEELVKPLTDIFRDAVEIGAGLDILSDSWNLKRQQYLADSILDSIPDPGHRESHLGVLDVDIFAPGLNFVFGEADALDKKAIISITRLRQEFYGLPSDEDLLKERILIEAVHELGHVYRLKHCPSSRCVMHFSNTLRDTDIKGWQFCPVCQRKLAL